MSIQGLIEGLNNRLKYVSVLQYELAETILPPKKSGTFKHLSDLNNTIKHREKLSEQAKLVCNWIYKSPLEQVIKQKPKKKLQFNAGQIKYKNQFSNHSNTISDLNILDNTDSYDFNSLESYMSPRDSLIE